MKEKDEDEERGECDKGENMKPNSKHVEDGTYGSCIGKPISIARPEKLFLFCRHYNFSRNIEIFDDK